MNEINEPYLFQTGKHAGEYLEELIFKNPDYIISLNNYRKGKNINRLQNHLETLLENTPRYKKICPICGERTAKYFLFLNHEDINKNLVCCENYLCQTELKINHPQDYLLPIKLKTALSFRSKRLTKEALRLIKEAVGIRKINANEIFSIFIGEQIK